MSILENLGSAFVEINNQIKTINARLQTDIYSATRFMMSEYMKQDKSDTRDRAEYGFFKGLCIDTIDPYLLGRVRIFCPYFNKPGEKIEMYPFANPISAMGGFDDCGLVWVPPAGSQVVVIFEHGYSYTPFYIGTIWNQYRGQQGSRVWQNSIGPFEFNEIHDGHRKGYFHGPSGSEVNLEQQPIQLSPNDESQVYPQWNTDNYQHYDRSQVEEKETKVVENGPQLTYPHIYGFKTPQKHMWKADDGDYKCNQRWKRMEFLSSCGNWMLFKDDHIHEGGQWAHPDCNVPCGEGQEADCLDKEGNPKEFVGCEKRSIFSGTARNKYFKHQNECRPYKGPGTPQNNRCELPQSGVQILSISGHTMIFDDSVEEPQGIPEWERSLKPFDFGCTDRFLGKTIFKSTTGHRIEMNDEESSGEKLRGNPEYPLSVKDGCRMGEGDRIDPWKQPIFNRSTDVRPRRNGILLLTATGNRIEMADDTISSGLAGPNRGITLQTTSTHTLEMIDHFNEQQSPLRREGGIPVPKAKRAFVRLRTGYGLMLEMRDNFSQEECQEQYMLLQAPQKKACAGPHFIRMQEYPTCGFIMVRAAGEYFRFTEGFELIVVGNPDGCLGPTSRLLYVSDTYVTYVERLYFNYAMIHVFFAEQFIVLAAGRDCPSPGGGENGPCLARCATDVCAVFCPIMPFLIALTPLSFSDRVFVSNGNAAIAAEEGCFG